MNKRPIYDEPGKAEADDGTVSLKGPDDVDVDMTPDAAEQTGDRLVEESVRARGQKRLTGVPRPK